MRKARSASSRDIPYVVLCEIVGPKRKELGLLCELFGGECRPRDFDHRPESIGDLQSLCFHDLTGRLVEEAMLDLQLIGVAGERDHDLGQGLNALPHHQAGGLEDRTNLHLNQLGQPDAQSDAAQAEHGVFLTKLFDGVE